LKDQIGKIIVGRRVKKGERSVHFSLSPHKPISRDVERVTFLAGLAGDACAYVQGCGKEFSSLWGSDNFLVIEARFLKGFPRQRSRRILH